MFGSLLEKIYLPEQFKERDFDLLADSEQMLLQEKTIEPPTEGTYYRISQLPRLCARQEVLRAVHRVTMVERVRPKQRRTFDFGNAFHKLVQDEWFGKWGWLIGDWRCIKCGALFHKQSRPSRCEFKVPVNDYICGGTEFSYIEEDVVSEQFKIKGHPDGTILKNGVKKILELKTSNAYYYKLITEVQRAALPAHKEQATLYMWLTGIKKAVIVYIDKDSSNWAQFPIEYSESIVEQYVQKVQSIRDGIKTGQLPGRICENAECARAKSCPVRRQCFT